MYTGSYDPADFSFRHLTPYNALFDGQMEFYLFCQKMQYKTLSDLVRVGIQSGLDLISRTPLPTLKDMIHIWDWKENRRKHIFLLMYLFFTAHRCYSKLSQSDPLKRHFVRYASNLWREYQFEFNPDRRGGWIAKEFPELWKDMKAYKEQVPVDAYESLKLNSSGFSGSLVSSHTRSYSSLNLGQVILALFLAIVFRYLNYVQLVICICLVLSCGYYRL